MSIHKFDKALKYIKCIFEWYHTLRVRKIKYYAFIPLATPFARLFASLETLFCAAIGLLWFWVFATPVLIFYSPVLVLSTVLLRLDVLRKLLSKLISNFLKIVSDSVLFFKSLFINWFNLRGAKSSAIAALINYNEKKSDAATSFYNLPWYENYYDFSFDGWRLLLNYGIQLGPLHSSGNNVDVTALLPCGLAIALSGLFLISGWFIGRYSTRNVIFVEQYNFRALMTLYVVSVLWSLFFAGLAIMIKSIFFILGSIGYLMILILILMIIWVSSAIIGGLAKSSNKLSYFFFILHEITADKFENYRAFATGCHLNPKLSSANNAYLAVSFLNQIAFVIGAVKQFICFSFQYALAPHYHDIMCTMMFANALTLAFPVILLPILNAFQTYFILHGLAASAHCVVDWKAPLPTPSKSYVSSYSELDAVLKSHSVRYLPHQDTSVVAKLYEAGKAAGVRTEFMPHEGPYILVRARNEKAYGALERSEDFDSRVIQHVRNMLVLDDFKSRASYARYICDVVGSSRSDEKDIVWTAYKAVVLDGRASRYNVLQGEKEAAWFFIEEFNVHPRDYSRALMDNIRLHELKRFGANASRDVVEVFYDNRGRPSRARYVDYVASKSDFYIRRYALQKTGAARAPFLRFSDSKEEVGFLESICRWFEDAPLSRGSWIGIIIVAFLGFFGISVKMFGGDGPDDSDIF